MNLKESLLQIRYFEFTAQTTLGTKGWEGTGKGEVKVAQIDANTLIFYEKGVFLVQNKTVKCYNTYRWTFEGELVKLEHLRFGIENPVLLFYMQGRQENKFVSVCPHVCDKDLYKATLQVTDHDIKLMWCIEGKEKNEAISYHYTHQ